LGDKCLHPSPEYVAGYKHPSQAFEPFKADVAARPHHFPLAGVARSGFVGSRGSYAAALSVSLHDCGFPFILGLSACSTETKKTSKSMWRIQSAVRWYLNFHTELIKPTLQPIFLTAQCGLKSQASIARKGCTEVGGLPNTVSTKHTNLGSILYCVEKLFEKI
jgi:hypothetical protein